jgi:hypothetical protein
LLAAIPYPELLAYAQTLSAFTSAPPNIDVADANIPGHPPSAQFFPPFPNEEKMRRGRLNAEAPLGMLGELHTVGQRLSQPFASFRATDMFAQLPAPPRSRKMECIQLPLLACAMVMRTSGHSSHSKTSTFWISISTRICDHWFPPAQNLSNFSSATH